MLRLPLVVLLILLTGGCAIVTAPVKVATGAIDVVVDTVD